MCAAAPKVLLFLVFLFIVDSAHAGSKGSGSKSTGSKSTGSTNVGTANQFPAVGGNTGPGGGNVGPGSGNVGPGGGGGANDDMVAGKVICNVISFVRAIGLPIMTGVILGSSIMAIFGRLAWPAIAILVVFTGVFFGADKLVKKFADGVGPTSVFSCT
ncbi:type IV secretion system protein VirB2 [Anaplasma centrale str. Israel]|uniref:Type IV secretion system protein VirB2 n=1 Tax=Anaplasma centrale (strain Israel) TaxID=574556 RepID=D1ATT4_ANACI|nr:type IV secretion system protein VirB2 [Anaplasma centrale str. Israel]